MKNKDIDAHRLNPVSNSLENINFPGYTAYPKSEDIYNRNHKEADMDPEDITKNKVLNERAGTKNEKDFTTDISGSDLDIPGSELDDEQEDIGSEDEENNGYSLGGDDHNDLEEDKGE